MRIAIYCRQLKEKDWPYIDTLLRALQEQGASVCVFEPFYQMLESRDKEYLANILPQSGTYGGYESLRQFAPDFLISLGGDGTILEAILQVRNSNIPIAGINLGRLGFLAAIEKERIASAVLALQAGAFTIDRRNLLHLEAQPNIFGEHNFALNDFTLLKRDTSSMIIIHTYLNGAFLNSYWADGIIVSTPTGSTGYSLSCGGPIIFPNSANFVITPVAPHNLNVRPIVISDDSVISFEIEGRADNFLCTLDSRYATIDDNTQLAVRKADFKIAIVRLSERSFLSTIRDKLVWGLDTRND